MFKVRLIAVTLFVLSSSVLFAGNNQSQIKLEFLQELKAEGLITQGQFQQEKNNLKVTLTEAQSSSGTASINGTITLAGGIPVGSHIVTLYNILTPSNPTASLPTDGSGNFSFTSLDAGSYFVRTGTNRDGFLHYIWRSDANGGIQLCQGCNSSITPDNHITIAAAEILTGINFEIQVGGVITGTFSDATTAAAIGTVQAIIYNTSDNSYSLNFQFIVDNITGNYDINGIPNGTYKMYLRGQFDQSNEYIPQVYGGSECNNCFSLKENGTDIVINSLNTVNNIDFLLNKGASLSGKIVDNDSSNPLPNYSFLMVFDELNYVITTMFLLGTNLDPLADGNYFIGGLLPGSYYVQGGDLGFDFYQRKVYNNMPCYWSGCDRSTGEAIVLGSNDHMEDIDFLLNKGGKISGTITDELTGLPISEVNLQVQFFDSTETVVGGARARNDGTYISARALPPGDYAVRTGNLFAGVLTQPYVNEKYLDIECSGLACDLSSADVSITADTITGGIDFALNTGNSFSGTITDLTSGDPIPDVHVLVYKDMGVGLMPKFANWSTTSDGTNTAIGTFTVSGLPNGTYYAVTNNGSDLPFAGVRPANGDGWIDILYNGMACPAAGCDIASGTPIILNATRGSDPIINFPLNQGASISGTITDFLLNAPIVNIKVNVFNSQGDSFGSFTSDSLGQYKTAGLPADTYYLTTSSFEVLVDVKYGNTSCEINNCNPLDAVPIVLSESQQQTNIDFILKADYLFGNGYE
ncbi:MAG: carboxypeptidase-like regulatory domain-containing protein [Proteobacteria bacterium]|nr:carboxypeptidase-like regulatory domain-containing protein [Pseudomonadota bacterium]